MELRCCLSGDSVGFPSSGESGSSSLPVEVESVGPAVPTDLGCLVPVEKFVFDGSEEIVDLLEAWLCLEELERVDEFSATCYEDASVVLHGWSS